MSDLFASSTACISKRPLSLALLVVATFTLPGAAQACRVAAAQTPLLHKRLPELGPGLVAAEVEIVTDVRSDSRPPLEARIIRMISGDYAGTRLRIEPLMQTSCDGVPYPGTRGFVIGRVLSASDEILVVDPLRAPSAIELHRQRAAGAESDR